MTDDSVDQLYPFRNPVHNASGGIDVEIEHPKWGWIPCSINSTEYTQLWAEVNKGVVAPYVPDPVAVAHRARQIRADLLETLVDPYAANPLRWADLSDKQRDAIATYRRKLLDITKQKKFPLEIDWPEQPKT